MVDRTCGPIMLHCQQVHSTGPVEQDAEEVFRRAVFEDLSTFSRPRIYLSRFPRWALTVCRVTSIPRLCPHSAKSCFRWHCWRWGSRAPVRNRPVVTGLERIARIGIETFLRNKDIHTGRVKLGLRRRSSSFSMAIKIIRRSITRPAKMRTGHWRMSRTLPTMMRGPRVCRTA